MEQALTIPNSRETHFINVSQILYIKADGDYINIYLTNNDPIKIPRETGNDGKPEGNTTKYNIQLTIQLGVVDKIIQKSSNDIRKHLVRIDRSYIINIDYIFKINLTESSIYLMDPSNKIYSLKISRERLAELKKKFEK